MPTTSDVSGEAENTGHDSDVPQVCRPLCSQHMELVAACVCVCWGGGLVQTTHSWMLLLLGPYAEGQAGPLVGGTESSGSCGVSPWSGSGSPSGRTHSAHT